MNWQMFLQSPVVAAVALGLLAFAGLIVAALIIRKPLATQTNSFSQLVELLDDMEREGIRQRIAAAVDPLSRGLLEGADRLAALAATSGLVWEKGEWRPVHVESVMPTGGDDARPDLVLDDSTIGSHQLLPVGLLFDKSYSTLPVSELVGVSPANIKQEQHLNLLLWEYLTRQITDGAQLWHYHPDFPRRWSWYQYIRSMLIVHFGVVLYAEIEQQFPGLANDPTYREWRQQDRFA